MRPSDSVRLSGITPRADRGTDVATLARLSIVLLALLFCLGGLAAWLGWLNTTTYALVTGVAGSIASVIGLVALCTPRLTANDVRDVEADLVRGLADTMASVKQYEERAALGRQEIDNLAQERAEIELLVRQAALKVFLEERLRHIRLEVEKRVDGDATLSSLLSEYDSARERAADVGGEIQRSSRADLVNEIVRQTGNDTRAAPRRPITVTLMGRRIDISPVISVLDSAATAYVGALTKLLRP